MRSVAPWILVLSAGLVSFAACGPGEDIGDGGDIGDCEEMCDGDTLVTCDDDGEEVETDCTDEFSSCIEIDGTFGCAAAVGASCLESSLSLCEGTEAGCVDDGDDGDPVCEENVGTCVAADARTCDGETLTAECQGDQPYTITCDAYGATCEAGTGCVGDADAFCDDVDFFCADGLSCVANTCE